MSPSRFFMFDGYTPLHGRVSSREIASEAQSLGLLPLWGEEITPGDLYMAGRNTGVKLLTCRSVHERGWVEPNDGSYPYDCIECVKVVEINDVS